MPDSIRALMARLDALGLTPKVLVEAGVPGGEGPGVPEDETEVYRFRLRTSLYLPQIELMYNFLRDNNQARVARALQDPRLLAHFCIILDEYVIPGLSFDLGGNPNADLRGDPNERDRYTDLKSYFTIFVLNDRYADNLVRFAYRYPTTAHATAVLTGNFRRNIGFACERILADWGRIGQMFGPIDRLIEIRPMGSDFHKGGQQVLRLTFQAPADAEMWSPDVRIMYKPSDLEADCLIIGDSAPFREVDDDFMPTGSLMEILNELIPADHPHLRRLPTYRILPRNYGSSYGDENPFPVRRSYGYIQYLPHDDWIGANPLSDYLWGEHNRKLYHADPARREEINRNLCLMAGALVAIACTFSLRDLHLENVIVSGFRPFLIDLEVSLTNLLSEQAQVRETNLLEVNQIVGNLGGFTGSFAFVRRWQLLGVDGRLYYQNRDDVRKYGANRLVTAEPAGFVPLLLEPILLGLSDMLDLLGAHVDDFNAWFGRLQRVVVRYGAIATTDLVRMVQDVYFVRPNQGIDESTAAVATDAYQDAAHEYMIPRDPAFQALNPEYTRADLAACDVPIYYRRIDQPNIMDSRGNPVVITNNITVAPGFVVNVGRDQYFAQPAPTRNNVQDLQLEGLRNWVARGERIHVLSNQVTIIMNQNNVDDQLQALDHPGDPPLG